MYKRHKGGAGWRDHATGKIETERGVDQASSSLRSSIHLDDDGCARTNGNPTTAERFLDDGYWRWCQQFATEAHGIPALIVAGIMFIESGRKDGHLDPVSIRHESGYISDEETPCEVSAGVIQTLLCTARNMCEKTGWLPLDPLGNPRPLQLRDLYIAQNSIYLGAAYMQRLDDAITEHKHDAVLISCAYNAGRVRDDMTVGFHLYCKHSDDRILKMIAYHNDLVHVLTARGMSLT